MNLLLWQLPRSAQLEPPVTILGLSLLGLGLGLG